MTGYRNRSMALWATLLLGALCGFGCGGSSHFDGVRFQKRSAAYRIGSLPAGFERVQVKGLDLAFAAKQRGTVSVNALCQGYEDVPPRALRNHLLFGFQHPRYLHEEEILVDGRSALHSVVEAELDGAPVRVELVLLVKDGCVFDIDYVSDRGARDSAAFLAFARQLVVERTGRE